METHIGASHEITEELPAFLGLGIDERLHFVIQFERELTPSELDSVSGFVGNSLDGRLDYTIGLYTFEETGTEIVTITGLNGLQVTMGSSGESTCV